MKIRLLPVILFYLSCTCGFTAATNGPAIPALKPAFLPGITRQVSETGFYLDSELRLDRPALKNWIEDIFDASDFYTVEIDPINHVLEDTYGIDFLPRTMRLRAGLMGKFEYPTDSSLSRNVDSIFWFFSMPLSKK